MTREEEIIQTAHQKEKEVGFSQFVRNAKGVNSAYGIGFLEGAEWADKHPKEVDLEKEVDSQMDLLWNLRCYMEELSNGGFEGVYPFPVNVNEDLQRFAKHFFELGLKATQKGG